MRRVETVTHLDAQRIERRTTLDIDCACLRDLARDAGGGNATTLLVPIALLPKGLLLDIDVRDKTGAVVPVSVSDRDSSAATALMLARLAEIPGVDPAQLNPAIPQKLYDIASAMPKDDEDDEDGASDWSALTEAHGDDVLVDLWRIDPSLTVSDADVEQWRDLFEDGEFSGLVLTFSLQYMLMSTIDVRDNDVCTIKLRHVEVSELDSNNTLAERLGLSAFYYLIDAPAVGRAAREHLRVVAPPGTFLQSVTLVDLSVDVESQYKHLVPAFGAGRFQSRVTPERAVIYSKGLPEGSYSVMVALRPALGGFVRPAIFSVGASLLLIVGGLWEEASRGVLTSGRFSIEAAVAILLIFPSLSTAYIAGEGEHELLRRLLTYPRVTLALSAIATVLAAGVVVIDVSRRATEIWWLVAAVVNALVLTLLLCIHTVSRRSEKSVRKDYRKTRSDRPVRF